MKISKILFLLLTPLLLFGYQNNKTKIIQNMVNKQEQIVTLVENYILSGTDVDLRSTTNKYSASREKIGRYFNIDRSFFNNISNEVCSAVGTICTNNGGLEFEVVEQNNKYIGVMFYNSDVYGSRCVYCNSLSFGNLYKNIIIGDRIKMIDYQKIDATSTTPTPNNVFYPFKRHVLDLFTKVEIYYSMYGDSLHIGSTPPDNSNKVWVDVRGNVPIERFWYSDAKKWLEKTSKDDSIYVNSKQALLKLPTINGSKIKVLSDNGMTVVYSYNDVYKTSVGCQNTDSAAADYDEYCGWLKVITGLDDYDFIINGIQLANE